MKYTEKWLKKHKWVFRRLHGLHGNAVEIWRKGEDVLYIYRANRMVLFEGVTSEEPKEKLSPHNPSLEKGNI